MRLGIEALGITLAGLEPFAEQTGLAFALARQALGTFARLSIDDISE